MKTEIESLKAALAEAIAVANACKEMCDEPGNVYFSGGKPNWKRAALGVIDEIADKPEQWEMLL